MGAVDWERIRWRPRGMGASQRPVVCAEAELPPRAPSCSPDCDKVRRGPETLIWPVAHAEGFDITTVFGEHPAW